MIVAISANLANIGLNVLLVYGFDLDIAGSALGTALAQTAPASRWSWWSSAAPGATAPSCGRTAPASSRPHRWASR